MQDWLLRSPGKDSNHSLSTPGRNGNNVMSLKDLADSHAQLRHEASGLKLQLAAKQEVLERSVESLDTLIATVDELKLTVNNQEKLIKTLTDRLKEAEKRESNLKIELEKARKAGGSLPSTENFTASPQTPAVEPALADTNTNNTVENNNKKKNNASNGGLHNTAKQQHTSQPRTTTKENSAAAAAEEENRKEEPPHSSSGSSSKTGIEEITMSKVQKARAMFEEAARNTPPPLPNKPELVPSCKITMAARASGEGKPKT